MITRETGRSLQTNPRRQQSTNARKIWSVPRLSRTLPTEIGTSETATSRLGSALLAVAMESGTKKGKTGMTTNFIVITPIGMPPCFARFPTALEPQVSENERTIRSVSREYSNYLSYLSNTH